MRSLRICRFRTKVRFYGDVFKPYRVLEVPGADEQDLEESKFDRSEDKGKSSLVEFNSPLEDDEYQKKKLISLKNIEVEQDIYTIRKESADIADIYRNVTNIYNRKIEEKSEV